MFVRIIKMIEYDRIDISEGIDVDMTNKSRECILCHYWYFLDNNFSNMSAMVAIIYHKIRRF